MTIPQGQPLPGEFGVATTKPGDPMSSAELAPDLETGKFFLKNSKMEIARKDGKKYPLTEAEWVEKRAKSVEKAETRKRKYYEKNKGRIIVRVLEWRQRNVEKVKAHQAQYRMAHKAPVKPAKLRKTAEEKRVIRRAWEKKNRVALNAKRAARRKAKPDHYRARRAVYRQNRRAQESSGRLSSGIVDRLMVLQRGQCPYCRANLREVKPHLDHVIALSTGGTNTDENVQLLCPPCNLTKSAKHPVEFARTRGLLL